MQVPLADHAVTPETDYLPKSQGEATSGSGTVGVHRNLVQRRMPSTHENAGCHGILSGQITTSPPSSRGLAIGIHMCCIRAVAYSEGS